MMIILDHGGVGFNFFNKVRRLERDVLSDYPVLFMLIYLWPGYCENHLENIS